MDIRKLPYSEKLKLPQWQKKRLELFTAANWTCEICTDKPNSKEIHHRWYCSWRMPWEYPDCCFQVLCAKCHEGVKQKTLTRIEAGIAPWDDWELALEHFGDRLMSMYFAEIAERALYGHDLPR